MATEKNFDPKRLGTWIVAGLCLAALVAYFWMTNNGAPKTQSSPHPLASEIEIDLCRMLDKPIGATKCFLQGYELNTNGGSFQSDNGKEILSITLITNRNVALGKDFTTADWLQQAIPEIRKSGRRVLDEPKGAWDTAFFTIKDNQLELLIEDHGALLVLQTSSLGQDKLLAYANQCMQHLRQRPLIPVSSGGAIQ